VANSRTTPRLDVSIEGIRVEVEKDSATKSFVTYVPALGNLSTFGETLEIALDHTRDMLLTYIVSMDDDGLPLPFPKAEVKRLRRVLQTPILDRMSS
jgi:predicted RNase H-like HicB family nuclease